MPAEEVLTSIPMNDELFKALMSGQFDETVKEIVEIKFEDARKRIEDFNGKEAAQEFIDGIVDAAKDALINQLKNIADQLNELKNMALSIPQSMVTMVAQLALVDPMAPIASMGVVNSAIASIGMIKGQIDTFTTTMTNLVANCTRLEIDLGDFVPPLEVEVPSDDELVQSCVVTIADNSFQQYISMSGEGVSPGSTQVGIKVNTEVTFTFNGQAGSLSWVINGEVISPAANPLKYSSWTPQENIVTVQ